MFCYRRELIEKSQKVNEGMISEMLVHIAGHTTSVADLLKQTMERNEHGRVETLEHCRSMVASMSESILEQAQRQIHTVAQQQRADMDKLQEELARTSRATSLQIQRQSAEILEQVRGMVSDVANRLDESVSQQGVQLLGRCKQMLSEREQAMRSLGEDNTGLAAVNTSSASTCALTGGKTMLRDGGSKVHVEALGTARVTEAPVVGSAVLLPASSGLSMQSVPVSSSGIAATQLSIDPHVKRDNVFGLAGGEALPPQSSTATTGTVKAECSAHPVLDGVAGVVVGSDKDSSVPGPFSELVGCISELSRKITSLTVEHRSNNCDKDESSGSRGVPVEGQTGAPTASQQQC